MEKQLVRRRCNRGNTCTTTQTEEIDVEYEVTFSVTIENAEITGVSCGD